MKTISLSCTECGGAMHAGFIPDEGQNGGMRVQRWVEGTPEKHWLYGIKIKKKEVWQVVTYRCASCGCLKSYARERL